MIQRIDVSSRFSEVGVFFGGFLVALWLLFLFLQRIFYSWAL